MGGGGRGGEGGKCRASCPKSYIEFVDRYVTEVQKYDT